MAVKSALTDDCFAKFDAAFESLAAELEATTGNTSRTTGSTTLRIVPPPDGEGRAPRIAAGYGQPMDEYVAAFDLLDAQLAASTERPGDEAATTIAPAAADAAAAVRPSPPASDAAPLAPLAPVVPAAPASPGQEIGFWRKGPDGGTPLARLMGTLQNLSLLQRRLNERSTRSADRITLDDVAGVFNEVRALCVEFDLQTARVRADFAIAALESDQLDALSNEISELVRHVRHDLQSCSIVPIPRDRVWSFSVVLDERTAASFPAAQAELAEGALCYGFGRYTACAFHLLRAAEPAMRVLGQAADRRRKGRDGHDAPRGGALVGMLESRLADTERSLHAESSTQGLEFLQAVLGDVRRLQEAESRLTSGTIDEREALALYHATRDLLARVAAPVTRLESRAVLKRHFA
jgi:hypothetical protein